MSSVETCMDNWWQLGQLPGISGLHLCGSPSATWVDISVSASVKASRMQRGETGIPWKTNQMYPNVPSNIPISSESPHLGKVSRNDAKHRRPNFWIFILTATGSHPQQHGSSTAMTRLHRKGNKCHILSSCMTHGTHCQSCLCSDLLQAALPWRRSVKRCTARSSNNFPPSLEWSCNSWAKAWQVVVLWWP